MKRLTILYDICDSLRLLADSEVDDRPGLAMLLSLIAEKLRLVTDEFV